MTPANSNKRLIPLQVGIAIIAIGLPVWLSPDPAHQNNHLKIILSLSVALTIIFMLVTKLKAWVVWLTVSAGAIAAVIINIIIDIFVDLTSHNLLPFEIMIYGVAVLAASLAGAALGLLLRIVRDKVKKKSVPL